MDPLHEFSQRVAARIAKARKRGASASDSAQYMAQFEPRYRQFEQLARRLMTEVIQPRLEVVARLFPNTKVRPEPQENRCVAWFGYCERVPNSVKLDLAVDADDRLEQIVVRYDLRIIPTFMKYEAHDKLVQPLAQVEEGQIAAWIEERLLHFLDTYVSLDRGEDDVEQPVATDPVCGMQVLATSSFKTEYRGHPYYFCSEACVQRFSETPERFVLFELD